MSDDNVEETVGDDAGASMPGSESPIDATIAEAEAIAAAAAMTPDEVLSVMRERDEFKGMLQRLQSDFENYRKRSLREQDTAAERAGEKVVNRLLPVLDTFELALTHEADPDNGPLAKMHDSLLTALESEGLERVAPAGMPFDPNQADAVMHEEGDADSTGPTVTDVLRAGYLWKGRVVRPAMVKVKG